jgi:hypothetical protein
MLEPGEISGTLDVRMGQKRSEEAAYSDDPSLSL